MAKVAILYEILGRSKGGIEAWVYHSSGQLLKQGHQVTLFHTMKSIPDDAAPPGVNLIAIPFKAVSPSIFFLRFLFNTKKNLKGKLESFDYVWARSFKMAWAASRLLPYNKVIYINAAPYSFYARRPFSYYFKEIGGIKGTVTALSSQLAYKIAYYFEKAAIQRCMNVYLSQERKRQTLSFFNINESLGKFIVIPAGVNVDKFHPSTTQWNGEDVFQLIAVCRLSKDKNVQCILTAISILKSKGIDVHLTIVGEGDYEKQLRRLVDKLSIEGDVSMVGRKEDIENWYRKSHVFVLPSLYEGFGSVYVEAMASGLPCIAISNKSGKYSVAADEIIDHGKNGLLMKDNSAEELANYILELFRVPEKVRLMSDNARKKAVNYFSWESTIDKLLSLT